MVVVFDLSGRGGRQMALACEEASVAGFYALRPSTGMFKKVRSVMLPLACTGIIFVLLF